MGANEIANRVEASAWVAAAGQTNGENIGRDVEASDFFFRSLSGFVSRMEILGADVGSSWEGLSEISIALFLDRNYARKDTAVLLNPIDTYRPQDDDPAVILPVVYEGPLRILPLSPAGFQSLKDGGATPFTLPASLDPYSILLIIVNLLDFQQVGKGLEFGIELLRMPDNEGVTTAVSFFQGGG